MKKGSAAGYIFVFLLGAGITALIVYIYTAMVQVAPAPAADGTDYPVTQAESEGAAEAEKDIAPLSGAEKPGNRSYLPEKKERVPLKADAPAESVTPFVERPAPSAERKRPSEPVLREKRFSVFLNQEDINLLLQKHISENGENGLLPPGAVKNAKLDIRGNELGLSAVINLDQIAEVTASEEDRRKLETVKKMLPFIDTKNLSLEVSGDFNVRNGMLSVDSDADIKIGAMKMGLKTLHGLLLPGKEVPAEVPLQPVQGIQIENLNVKNGGIEVSGTQTM